MVEFNGTLKAFKRYLGPFLRVLVQQMTKGHRASIGACEHCGRDETLEAAHVFGRTRINIIDLLLGTSDSNALVQVNLKEFEAAFRCEHDPVEKVILILCNTCHLKYDSRSTLFRRENIECDTVAIHAIVSDKIEEIMPISLDRPRPDDFKDRLLERREAVIEVHYGNGNIDRRTWIANRFIETSNVFGNLRSRPEFRQGRWQELGIIKVHVRVVV